MPRIIFPGNAQIRYLKTVKSESGLNSDQLAAICGIVGRSFRDWARGKLSISQIALTNLKSIFPQIKIPKDIKVVDDYWYAAKGGRKGALRRFELYGPLATPEGRKKGGIVSQLRRKENPEKYRLLGCNVRKEYKIDKLSIEFAEAAGIILGDGGLSDNQLKVTVSSIVDREYAKYISFFFEKIFGSLPSWYERSDCNAIDLVISGVNLVEELEKWGFVRGNKVKHQIDFPGWIWSNLEGSR